MIPLEPPAASRILALPSRPPQQPGPADNGPYAPSAGRAQASRAARWTPWIAWLLALVAACAFVLAHAPRVPFLDDLDLAAHLLPDAELSLRYLWSPHNEHRIPLPRLVLIPLIRATGDFRSGMLLEVALLGALAAGMILLARRVRGRQSALDAVFPLLWLSLGNAENLLMAFQVSLALPVLASCGIWMLALVAPSPPGPRRAAAMGLCLIALPLCGGHGLTQAPALLVLALAAGWRGLRSASASRKRGGLILWASAAATAVLVGLYFVGYQAPPGARTPPDLLAPLRTTAELASLVVGPLTWHLAPWSNLAAGAALAGTAAWLLARMRRDAGERLRYGALLAGLAAVCSMAASLGLGREAPPGAGMAMRYVVLAAPLLCCAWFAALLAAGRGARVTQGVLLALVALGWPWNAAIGRSHARERRMHGEAFERHRALGLQWDLLASQFAPVMYEGAADLEVRLGNLERGGFLPPPQVDGALPLLPESYRSDGRMAQSEQWGVPILLAQPESEIVLPVPHPVREVHGGFGLHPHAVGQGSDGALFRIELVQLDGARATLLERTLDPTRDPDAALRPQSFRLELPGAGMRKLILSTSNAPGRGAEDDWTYWARVRYR